MGLFSRFRNKPLQRKNIGKCNSVEGEFRDNFVKSEQEASWAASKLRNYKNYLSLLELSQQKITRKEFDKRRTGILLESLADNLTSINEYIKRDTNKKIVDFLGTSNIQEANSKHTQLEKDTRDAHTKNLIDKSVRAKFQDWRAGIGEAIWDEAKARAKAEREVKSI